MALKDSFVDRNDRDIKKYIVNNNASDNYCDEVHHHKMLLEAKTNQSFLPALTKLKEEFISTFDMFSDIYKANMDHCCSQAIKYKMAHPTPNKVTCKVPGTFRSKLPKMLPKINEQCFVRHALKSDENLLPQTDKDSKKIIKKPSVRASKENECKSTLENQQKMSADNVKKVRPIKQENRVKQAPVLLPPIKQTQKRVGSKLLVNRVTKFVPKDLMESNTKIKRVAQAFVPTYSVHKEKMPMVRGGAKLFEKETPKAQAPVRSTACFPVLKHENSNGKSDDNTRKFLRKSQPKDNVLPSKISLKQTTGLKVNIPAPPAVKRRTLTSKETPQLPCINSKPHYVTDNKKQLSRFGFRLKPSDPFAVNYPYVQVANSFDEASVQTSHDSSVYAASKVSMEDEASSSDAEEYEAQENSFYSSGNGTRHPTVSSSQSEFEDERNGINSPDHGGYSAFEINFSVNNKPRLINIDKPHYKPDVVKPRVVQDKCSQDLVGKNNNRRVKPPTAFVIHLDDEKEEITPVATPQYGDERMISNMAFDIQFDEFDNFTIPTKPISAKRNACSVRRPTPYIRRRNERAEHADDDLYDYEGSNILP